MNGENNDTSLLDPVGFGRRLQDRRNQVGLKQEDMVRIVGISIGAIQNYEAGKGMPNSKYLWAFANTLKCRIAWLLTGEGPIEPVEPHSERGQPGTAEAVNETPDIELATAMQLLGKIYYGFDPLHIAAIGITLKTFVDAAHYRREARSLYATVKQLNARLLNAEARFNAGGANQNRPA